MAGDEVLYIRLRPELKREVEQAASEDDRPTSREAAYLLRLGLEARKNGVTLRGGSAPQK